MFIYECDKLGWDGAVIGWVETSYDQYESEYYSLDRSSDVGCQFYPKTTLIYRLSECEGGHHCFDVFLTQGRLLCIAVYSGTYDKGHYK